MYSIVLRLHSLLRWLVFVMALLAALRAAIATGQRRGLTAGESRTGALLVAAVDTQLLLGLVLYATSLYTRTAMHDFALAMHEPALRYWAVEHTFVGLAAVACAHIARVVSKRGQGTASSRSAAVLYGITFLLVAVNVALPMIRFGRGFIRM